MFACRENHRSTEPPSAVHSSQRYLVILLVRGRFSDRTLGLRCRLRLSGGRYTRIISGLPDGINGESEETGCTFWNGVQHHGLCGVDRTADSGCVDTSRQRVLSWPADILRDNHDDGCGIWDSSAVGEGRLEVESQDMSDERYLEGV